jgi:AraC-like DNA-binding protein
LRIEASATVTRSRHRQREEAHFWRAPALGGLELLRATYRTFAFSPHSHETFAIGVTEQGAQLYTSGRHRDVVMPAGSVAVVHPGEVHTSRAQDARGWSYRMLYPPAGLIQEIAEGLTGRHEGEIRFREPVIDDALLASSILELHRSLETAGVLPLERESRLVSSLTRLIAVHADGNRPAHRLAAEPTRVKRVRELLDECPAGVTLRALAEIAELSPYHLLRVFRAHLGLPPHAYLIQVRVRRARRLLCEGLPIIDVAHAVGFVDQSHLTRHFKRLVGVPPGAYLKS